MISATKLAVIFTAISSTSGFVANTDSRNGKVPSVSSSTQRQIFGNAFSNDDSLGKPGEICVGVGVVHKLAIPYCLLPHGVDSNSYLHMHITWSENPGLKKVRSGR